MAVTSTGIYIWTPATKMVALALTRRSFSRTRSVTKTPASAPYSRGDEDRSKKDPCLVHPERNEVDFDGVPEEELEHCEDICDSDCEGVFGKEDFESLRTEKPKCQMSEELNFEPRGTLWMYINRVFRKHGAIFGGRRKQNDPRDPSGKIDLAESFPGVVFSSNFAFWGPKFGPKITQQSDPLGGRRGALGHRTASFENILRTSRNHK